MARSMPRISVALEYQQVDNKDSMVNNEGMIKAEPISIIIDLGAILSYVSPRIVEFCKLSKGTIEKYWLVQLAMGTKHKVTNYLKNYEIMMNKLNTHADLNILALGYYDLLIGMDCLEK